MRLFGRRGDVNLTPLETNLANILVLTLNRVVSYDQIIRAVWGNQDYHKFNVHTLVSRFRRKLEEEYSEGNFPYLLSVSNDGYKLRDPSKT